MGVLRLRDCDAASRLPARYGLALERVDDDAPIPGSYWGESEAGLIGHRLYARADTPVHSILHETGHFACMSPERRAELDTDAGGDDAEESAVCYLQVLLAGVLQGLSRERLFADMDSWGYSFRLGSTERWFREDAADAKLWLEREGLIDAEERPTWRKRAHGKKR